MLIYCILYTALECIYLSGFCLFKTLVVSESDKYMFNCLCLFIVALHWFNCVVYIVIIISVYSLVRSAGAASVGRWLDWCTSWKYRGLLNQPTVTFCSSLQWQLQLLTQMPIVWWHILYTQSECFDRRTVHHDMFSIIMITILDHDENSNYLTVIEKTSESQKCKLLRE